jgi:N12 class adenine-specific DNA methylase
MSFADYAKKKQETRTQSGEKKQGVTGASTGKSFMDYAMERRYVNPYQSTGATFAESVSGRKITPAPQNDNAAFAASGKTRDQYDSDVRKNYAFSTAKERPTAYSSDNLMENMDRIEKLSKLSTWNDAQRSEAEEILKTWDSGDIRNGIGGWWDNLRNGTGFANQIYNSMKSGEITPEEYQHLSQINSDLYNKVHKTSTGLTMGLIEGLGALSTTKAITKGLSGLIKDKDLSGALTDSTNYLDELATYGKKNAPVASAAGNIAGSLGLMSSIASGIGGIKGFSSLPSIAQSVISGGTALGGTSAVQELGDTAEGKQSWSNYAKDVGINAASGAAGGALASGVGSWGAKYLQSKGLAGNQLARTVLAGLTGTGFVTGSNAVSQASNYMRDPQNYDFDMKQFAEDALVGFAFSAFGYLTRNYTASPGAAAKMDADDVLVNKYFKGMSQEEASAAYHQYAKQYHPDLYSNADEATQQAMNSTMAEINRAYSRFNTTHGAAAYKAAQEARATGDTAAYDQASTEFRQSVSEIQAAAAESGISTAETSEAAQILNTVAEGMSGGMASETIGSAEPAAEESLPQPVGTEIVQAEETTPAAETSEGMTFDEAMAAFNGGGQYDVINHEAVNKAAEEGKLEPELTQAPESVPEESPAQLPQFDENTERAAVEDFAGTMDKAGALAIKSMYTPASGNAADYIKEMMHFYNAGRSGAEFMPNAERANINEAQAEAAYLAGQADVQKAVSPVAAGKSVQSTGSESSGLAKYDTGKIQEAINKSAMDGWRTNSVKSNRIKRAIFEATGASDEEITEILSKIGKDNVYRPESTKTGLQASKKSDTIKPEKKTFVPAKKADWSAHDVQYYVPGKKTPIAYSTISDRDLLSVLAEDNPTATISELRSYINYSEDAKRIIDAYIANGYGNENAKQFFYNDRYKPAAKADNAVKEGKPNDTAESMAKVPDTGAVQRAGAGRPEAGGLLDGVASEDVRKDEQSGQAPSDAPAEVSGAGRNARGNSEEGLRTGPDDGSGSNGSNERGNLQSASGEGSRSGIQESGSPGPGRLNTEPAQEPEAEPAPLEAVTQTEQIEQKAALANQEKPKGTNFLIPEKGGIKVPTTPKSRYNANVAAIRTLRNIMAENRLATPDEQELLAKYTGWGGLSNVFDGKNGFEKEFAQLKKLLDKAEYSAASASILNAYYTDPEIIRSMYKGLARLGYNGGRLLEPSAGVGRFLGAMPEDMLSGVRSFTAVELDKITGNVAKYLYPNADVRVQGFELTKIPQEYMDVAIGNVPFGNIGIADKKYPAAITKSIHNYFIAKSLDKVRPGGIAMLITSTGTLDARDSTAREYFMKQADLIGAIRLPNTAFQTTGTPVVSDILVFKKREVGTPYKGEAFINSESAYLPNSYASYNINEYFTSHSEMILGKPAAGTGQYGRPIVTYEPLDSRYSLYTQLERAFAKINVKMEYPIKKSGEQIRAEISEDAGKTKPGTIVRKDGKFYKAENGALVETDDIAEKDTERMTSVLEIRDTARKLLDAQANNSGAGEISIYRKNLNTLYDDFVKEHGILHKQSNQRLIRKDGDYPFIMSLEDYNKDTGKAVKAAIFTKNTIKPTEIITHADSIDQALTIVLNEVGTVDTARIAQLIGGTNDAVRAELLGRELAYLDRNGNLEPAVQYLSGNVRAKLRDAEALAEGNPEYKRNIEALKKIIPSDIAPEDISVRLGATWIPDSIYSKFASEMLGGNTVYNHNRGQIPSIEVNYKKQLGKFFVTINEDKLRYRPENFSEWGTSAFPLVGPEGKSILSAALNNKTVSVWHTVDETRVLDVQATQAAQEKLAKVLTEFSSWLWRDDKRRTELGKLYNETFNNTVTPKYDGASLTVNGSNPEMQMRPHQLNAVQRIISSGGNTLLAHRVGAGKTYEMAAAAMKLRQLGIVKKPVFIVPNHLTAQWGDEFLSYFPAAKIKVVEKGSVTAKNRKIFANQIATGDYDAVIMSYEQFEAIPMSMENQEAFYQDQIDILEQAILEYGRGRGRDPSVRDMERSKLSFETKLKKLAEKNKKDEYNINFEQLGIDALFVDEAHNFKNLFYSTKMQGVADLGDKEGAGRSFDLYMKVRYLQKLNGGRGIVFATATPVMNSVVELYTMQRYLQPDLLDAKGITDFDAWVNQFGEVTSIRRMKPSGTGYDIKQSLSHYKNMAEMQQMFRAFADVIVDADELPYLEIPKMKGGKRIVVECEPGDFQQSFMEELSKRAEELKHQGKYQKGADHIFKIMGDGKMISYSQHMIDPSLPYEPEGKIMKCTDLIYKIWKRSETFVDKNGKTQKNGTQLVFCDRGVPGGTDAERGAGIYADMKNLLVGKGVPSEQIAFIHEAENDEAKEELFKKVNDGTVRILFGSSAKMGTGMNVQRRIVAMHELNAPDRPGDLEQNEGRALRQGNLNKEVEVYSYITKRTFDSRQWDTLKRKAIFIHQVMSGEYSGREAIGDGDLAASAAEISAIASDNPLILEQFDISEKINNLLNLERAHTKEVENAKGWIAKAHAEISQDTEYLSRYKNDLARCQNTAGDKFKLTLDNKTYTERKGAGEAIIAKSKSILRLTEEETYTDVGNFAGFKLLLTSAGDILLRGEAQYRSRVNMQSEIGTIQALESISKRIENMIASTETRLSENKAAIIKLEKITNTPFDRSNELVQLRAREMEIMNELNPPDNRDTEVEDTESLVDVENTADTVAQEISSAKTSIKQIPALFKDKNVKFGMVNIDIGGGRFDLATEYLKSIGTLNLVFDPYNRTEAVNADTLNYLRGGYKANTATCANVLNVIKEPDARANVILEAAKAILPNGNAYFMVYEGDGSGIGKETTAGWQNNRKTRDYMDEIRKYFRSVSRKGKLLIAAEPKSNLPKASWEISPGKGILYNKDMPIKTAGTKISAGMSDEQRYEILKDKTLTAPIYDHTKLKHIDTDSIDKLSLNDSEKLLRKLGEEFGVFSGYTNNDINVQFNFSKRNLNESLHKQKAGYSNYAKMLTVFKDVVSNAVGIETHPERYNNPASQLNQMYVLISAFRTQTAAVPVLLEVKEFKDKTGNVLYLTVSMHEIKETDIVAHASPANAKNSYAPSASWGSDIVAHTYTPQGGNASYAPSAPIYKIADIFKNVNIDDSQLLKYVPDGFLNKEQLAAKAEELKRTEAYIQEKNKRYDITNDGLPHPERWTAKRVGENKAPKPVSEIIAQIRHDFGLNVTFGHVRGKGVRGQFNSRDKGIRSRISNDLPTVCHELGHALDDRFTIISKDLTKELHAELKKALGDLSAGYDEKQYDSEGLAEFLRQYLHNRETAAIDYPTFTKYFLGKLDGKTLAILEQLADDVNAYYSLDADSSVSNIRLREEGSPDLRTHDEKIRQMGDAFYQAWIDANHGIKLFDQETGSSVYKLATNSAYSDAIAGRIITGDLTDANGQYVGPGLKTVLHGINTRDKKEYKAFGEYLVVRHGPEYLAEGKRVFADDRKNSTAFMLRRQLELEQQYPQFMPAAKRIYQFLSDLNKAWGVDTQVLSADQLSEWQQRWPNYVPFNRAIPKEGRSRGGKIGAKRGFANQNSPYKRAKGSGLDIIDPVDNIIDNIVLLVNVGIRNNVMVSLRNAAIETGADASLMEKIPTPMVPKAFDMTGVKAQLGEAFKDSDLESDDKIRADKIISNLSDVLMQFSRGKAYGNQVTVMVDGKPEFWKINDPLLLESITSMTPARQRGFLDAYAKTTRFMTANITGNNPIWSIFSNAPRDIATFAFYSKDKRPFKALSAIGSGYINAFNERFREGEGVDPLYAEYLAMGGGHTSVYSADADLASKARKALTTTKAQRVLSDINPLSWVTFISDTIEQGPRFATYKLMRQAGLSPQEAFYEAMDVTTNFRRAGYMSRDINKVVPFFNASVQGVDKFGRHFTGEDVSKEDRAKAVRNRWIGFFTASAILAALMYALNSRDEESKKAYQQLSNYTKNSYWCIPLGDGKFFAIPKPRELAVLTSFFETCMESYIGGNEHAFDEFYSYAADNFLPSVISDVAELPSNIAKEGAAQGTIDTAASAVGSAGLFGVSAYMIANRDFLGKPIESTTMRNLEPKDRYNNSTSKMAYWIGQAFNLSPVMIDYFGNQVLGYLWKAPKALFPVGEDPDYSLGVKSSYIKDNAYSQDLVNWLYDKASNSAMEKNSDKSNMDKAITAKLDSSMTEFYSNFNSLNKNKADSDARRHTRQVVLDMISEYQKSSDSNSTTAAQDAVYAVVRAAGEITYMPSVMNTYVKDGNDVKHDLSDDQYVSYQTGYLALYWDYAEKNLTSGMDTKEKAAVLNAAKDVANEEATNAMLTKIGADNTGYTTTYEGIDAGDVIQFKAQTDLADDDGSLKQEEVVDILETMINNGLDYDDAYTLFHSRYDSDKHNPWKKYAP